MAIIFKQIPWFFSRQIKFPHADFSFPWPQFVSLSFPGFLVGENPEVDQVKAK